MALSRYPLGIQDFKKLRSQNCVYVDKSAAIFDLTRNYYVFLSRPRRFGKSLLSSTLKYYFRGERELFTGLAIEKLETEWVKYPVLHFNTNVTQLDGIYVDASAFDRPTEALTDANPLLYQSGYLTIKDYNLHTDAYTLGIPNKEVRVGLMDNLLQTYTNKTASENSTLTLQMYSSLSDGNMDELFRVLKSYLSGIPYIEANGELTRKESFYETILYVIFSMMNRYVQTQVKTAQGRVDIVIESADTIYVIELKIDASAKKAMEQIDSKDYMLPYSAYGKSLVKCGVNFSSQTRTIEDWIVV